jgi:hypothetical protein
MSLQKIDVEIFLAGVISVTRESQARIEEHIEIHPYVSKQDDLKLHSQTTGGKNTIFFLIIK